MVRAAGSFWGFNGAHVPYRDDWWLACMQVHYDLWHNSPMGRQYSWLNITSGGDQAAVEPLLGQPGKCCRYCEQAPFAMALLSRLSGSALSAWVADSDRCLMLPSWHRLTAQTLHAPKMRSEGWCALCRRLGTLQVRWKPGWGVDAYDQGSQEGLELG